jgi:hypothetical protein
MDGWSLFVNVFCSCGWAATLTEQWTVRCDNPRCERYGQRFRLEIGVEPQDEAEVGEVRPMVIQ